MTWVRSFAISDPEHRRARFGGIPDKRSWSSLRQAGWAVVNVDVVIATEGPRIAPHRAAMRTRIGDLLGIEAGRVNIKGKSLEGLGALADGGTGVAVHATCLLAPRPSGSLIGNR